MYKRQSMTVDLRPPSPKELTALSQLCLRSKSYWGYDAEFMNACTEELTLTKDALKHPMIVAQTPVGLAGVAQLLPNGADIDLALLYVDPEHMGQGVGQRLFHWCVETARSLQARTLLIESDPNASAFYQHMGADVIGDAPSGSIPGRRLPLLAFSLK